jgi:hypothetical protein
VTFLQLNHSRKSKIRDVAGAASWPLAKQWGGAATVRDLMSPWTRLAYDARLLFHPPQLSVHGCQHRLHSYFQVYLFGACLIGLLFH